MSKFALSRPWLAAGIVSALVLLVGVVVFFAGVEPSGGAPNGFAPFIPIALFAVVVGSPAVAISLAAGGARVWRHKGVPAKALAATMLVFSLPFFLYSLFLLLALAGVIHAL
jgi:hypothetical protein